MATVNGKRGRQIYLTAADIDEVAGMVEWTLTAMEDELEDIEESLQWAKTRLRYRGPRPKVSDFDPRLPAPGVDYAAALDQWNGYEHYVTVLENQITELGKRKYRLESLKTKMWYYGE